MLDEEKRRRAQDRYPAVVFEDDSRIPPRQFLYGRHYLKGKLSCTIAGGGMGKSSLHIVEAVAMAAGRMLLGIEPEKRLRVMLWNGEEDLDELLRRIHAVCRVHGIDYRALTGWLLPVSGLDQPIDMALNEPKRLGWVEDFIQAYDIDVAMFDPLVHMHSLPEAKPEIFANLAQQWNRLAKRLGISVDIAHHVRKQQPGSEAERTADDARGGGSLINAARAVRVFNYLSKEEAEKAQIKASDRKSYIRVAADKMNYAKAGDEHTFHIIEKIIGNGDAVGVIVPWRQPGTMEGMSQSQAEEVWKRVSDGPWRLDWRSQQWVGQHGRRRLPARSECPAQPHRGQNWPMVGRRNVRQGRTTRCPAKAAMVRRSRPTKPIPLQCVSMTGAHWSSLERPRASERLLQSCVPPPMGGTHWSRADRAGLLEHKFHWSKIVNRPTCNSCNHFFAEGPTDGFCRRFPPAAFNVGPSTDNPNPHIMSAWPPVRGSAYCGEHRPAQTMAEILGQDQRQ